MKLLLPLLVFFTASAHAADPHTNPYVKDSVGLMAYPGMPGQTGTVPAIQPGTMASAQAAPLLEQVPPAFTENRNIFDSLAVVGLSQSHATLRYPMVGAQTGPTMSPNQGMPGAPGVAAMQAQSFRVLTVKDGDPVWLAGRRYTVKKEGDTVQILSGKGKNAEVVWIGQLEAPRSFTAPPPPESPVSAATTGAHAMGTVTPGAIAR